MCETWVETRTDCYFDQSSSSTIAALLPNLGRGCSTVGHWGFKALCLTLVLTRASCLQLNRTARASGYIIFYRPPTSVVLPLIYTGASLEIGLGSICNNHPILSFQNSTYGHFLHVPLHPSHTHNLQIMLKDNNSKNTKIKLLEQ